jgi:hypothetical protein
MVQWAGLHVLTPHSFKFDFFAFFFDSTISSMSPFHLMVNMYDGGRV